MRGYSSLSVCERRDRAALYEIELHSLRESRVKGVWWVRETSYDFSVPSSGDVTVDDLYGSLSPSFIYNPSTQTRPGAKPKEGINAAIP